MSCESQTFFHQNFLNMEEEYGSMNSANREKAMLRTCWLFISIFFLVVLAFNFQDIKQTWNEWGEKAESLPSLDQIAMALDSLGIETSALNDQSGETALEKFAQNFHDNVVAGVKKLLPTIEEQEIAEKKQKSQNTKIFWDREEIEKKHKGKESVKRICLYVETFEETACREYREAIQEGLAPVPPSITLAQGILETGISVKFSNLALEGNNHFGVKCGKNWRGPTFAAKDDEYDRNGNKIHSCFRKYNSPLESYNDHAHFLNGERYRWMKKYEIGERYEDKKLNLGWIGEKTHRQVNYYEAWAIGLKQSGYATSPTYAATVVAIINAYELWRIDAKVMGNHSNSKNKKL